MRTFWVAIGAAAWLSGGCASLREPAPAGAVLSETAVLPAAWTERMQREAARFGELAPTTVWDGFADPQMSALVVAAVTQTPDIRAAQARIRQARAARSIAASNARPTLSTSGSAARERMSQAVQPPIPGLDIPAENNAFDLGGAAGWAPDIWGETALRVRAADYDIDAAEAAAQAVALGLETETANTYVALRAGQQSLSVLDQSLSLLQRSLDLTNELVGQDLAPEFDAVQLRAEIAAQRALRARQESANVSLGYALAALSGQAPQSVDDLLTDAQGSIPAYRGGVRAGVPSTLLLRRPDLRQADAALRAARDLEEAEDLNRLPDFSLSGSGGFLSMTLDALISSENRRGMISAALNWPVYQGGRLAALREQADAMESLATAQYDGAVLTALREVEQAFEAHVSAERRQAALRRAVEERQTVVGLAELRYTSGLSSQFRFIEAQTALLTARLDLLEAERDAATAIIGIYAALGGDWS